MASRILLSFLVSLVFTPIAASAEPTPAEVRVNAVAVTLNVEIPPDWKFWVVSEPEWERQKKDFGSPSETAFSIVMMRLTVIRASYAATAPEALLRKTLAHEFGHALCWCTSENGADHAAQNILRKRTLKPPRIHFDSMPPR